MKIQIGEITVNQIQQICGNNRPNCLSCPLCINSYCLCEVLPDIDSNEEIEIDED